MKEFILNIDENKRKKLMIVLAILLILNIFLILIFSIDLKSNDSVNILRINEESVKTNIKITSKPILYSETNINEFLGNYIKLNLEIENANKTNLNIIPINFSLTDKNKFVIATSNYAFKNEMQLHDKTIKPKEKIRGSLFFSLVSDIENNTKEIEDAIKKTVYLKVSVIDKNNLKKDYYLEIN